MNAAKKACIKK